MSGLRWFLSVLLVSAPILFLGGASWWGIWQPLRQSEQELRVEIQDNAQLITKLNVRVAAHQEIAQSASTLPDLVWSKDDRQPLAASIQRQLAQQAAETTFKVSRIGPGSVGSFEGFVLSEVILEGESSLAGLVELLSLIQQRRPVIGISQLSIRPLSQRDQVDGETRVYVHMVAWGASEP